MTTALTGQESKSQVEITTLRGKTFKQVEIIQIEPDGILLTHQKGAAKILYEQMTVADKARYGYNPAVIKQAEEKILKEAQERKKKKAKAKARPRAYIIFVPIPTQPRQSYPNHTVPVHSTHGHPIFVSPHLYHYQNNLVPRDHYHRSGEHRVSQQRNYGNPIAAPMNSYRSLQDSRQRYQPMVYIPHGRARRR